VSTKRFPALQLATILATSIFPACGSPFSIVASGSDSGSDASAYPPDAGEPDAISDAAISEGAGGDGFAPAPHAAFPQVPNTSGRTLTAPTLVTIVASNDVATDGTDTPVSLQAFSDVLPGSAVWDAVSSEYQLGKLSSSAHLTGPAIVPGSYTLAQIETYVAGVIGGGAGPSPDGNTIYLLYLPGGASFSGVYADECGYHLPYPQAASAGDQLAIVRRCKPYPDQETQLGQLTRSASHEIVEAATDPLGEGYNLGKPSAQPWVASVWAGWVSEGIVELGDLCSGTRTFEATEGGLAGGWEFQRMWSNAAAAAGTDPCVPQYAEPYYSASAPQGWYDVQAGGYVDIPFTGWSAAATSDWLVHADIAVSKNTGMVDGGTGFTIDLTSEAGFGTVPPCYDRYAMNNALGAVVRVTAPASAHSGDFVVLRIDSFREKPAPSCDPPLSEDQYHFWPTGVHVQ
jgi:hypothetical protein